MTHFLIIPFIKHILLMS